MNKTNKLESMKVLPLIISMALPSMFSMLIQAMYNIVDSYFVALFSSDALAAVSLAFPIQNLIIGFAVGTGVGIASYVSRKLGEKDRESASKAATNGVFLSIITYLIFLIFGLFFVPQFLNTFETNQEVVGMGTGYLRIVTIFSFSAFVAIALEKVYQGTGNMIIPMLVQFIGAVLNIILDPIFIFVLDLGINGAALATVISQFVSLLLSLYLGLRKKSNLAISLSFKGFKTDKSIIKEIYRVGLPSIIMNCVGTTMVISLNSILSSFSTAAYTVFGLYFKIQSFIFMPVYGLCNGVLPIIGYNYGAKSFSRVKEVVVKTSLIAVSIMIVGTLIFRIFPTELINIFSPTEEILTIGIQALKTISITFVLAGLAIVSSTYFQAIGYGIYSMIISILRQLVLIVPLAYLLSKISLDALWYSFVLADLIAFIIVIVLLLKTRKLLSVKKEL